MVSITFIEPSGNERRVEAREGMSMMEAAIEHDIVGIEAVCGGACSCGTCKVAIGAGWMALLGPPGKPEEEMLDALEENGTGVRLSCQIRLDQSMDNISVAVCSTN